MSRGPVPEFRRVVIGIAASVVWSFATIPAFAQDAAALCGRVLDATGATLPGATVSLRNPLGIGGATPTTDDGRYCIGDLPPGSYRLTVSSTGFRDHVTAALTLEAGRTIIRDVWMVMLESRERVTVRGSGVDPALLRPGDRVDERAVSDLPTNGRHFVDLAVLAPTAVAPSQAGFSSRPGRGIGPVALNIAGNREEAVAFVMNGVSINNLTFGSVVYGPPISSLREIRVESSTFSVEQGHVSGAIVDMVSRSGSDTFQGEAYEFLRHHSLDARNHFALPADTQQLERHQFGGYAGGPLRRGLAYFFAAYEGIRHQQAVHMNSLVLSDAQRAAVTDPVIQQLLPFIPRANTVDGGGTPRFVGTAPAIINTDRVTIDYRQQLGGRHHLHAFWGRQRLFAREPTAQGNSVPGFGSARSPTHGMLTLNYAQTISKNLVNEARLGYSRLHGGTYPAAQYNPIDIGIRNGVVRPIGLPQMAIAGDLNFGGPAILPQGRFDTSWIFTDTVSLTNGRHDVRVGGEYRHFINENFAEGTGSYTFPSVAAFMGGVANAFNITLGERSSVIDQRAIALFAQDRVALRPNLTLEAGLRYEWHVTPTERDNRFIVFDAATASLQRVGVDRPLIYQQNNRNFEPRLALSWVPSASRRTVLRASYARSVDQPSTTAVRDTPGNPPYATPLTASGAINLGNSIDLVTDAGLAPVTIDPGFRNAGMHAWMVRAQHELTAGWVAHAAYVGSIGTDLRIARNLNQPINGVRPFVQLSDSSPYLAGRRLGNITQIESTGFSRYRALSATLARLPAAGWHFDVSYTWSNSRDTNSLNSSGFAVQDSYDIPGELGPSDFDARHRVVAKLMYALPFAANALVRDWHVGAVVQSQSGNPINIVTSSSSLNGLPNTVRPNVTGPVRIIGSVDQWFDTAAFVAVNGFGNLTRNAVIGPAYHVTDISLRKRVRLPGDSAFELRIDVFNVFNQVNLGPPGNIVGSPAFGRITRTRFTPGESGSSRQVQLAGKVMF
jgi:hypothetical protein